MQSDDTLAPENFIKAWRKHLRMTQEVLAAKVDLSPPGISMIERGKQGITLSKLAQIAEAFEITLPELMAMPPSSAGRKDAAVRREILAIFDQLPENLKAVYLAQTRALLSGAQAAEPSAADPKNDQQ